MARYGDDCEDLPTEKGEVKGDTEIIYNVEDSAPWHITIVYVLQQVASMAPGLVSICAAIHHMICGGEDYGFLAELVATAIFMLGVGTILQITFGIRLSIIQGSSWIFLAPIGAMMNNERYKCPGPLDVNATMSTEPAWSPRIRVISGSLMVGSALQMLLGLSGVFGVLLPYIGPLTIAPAMALLGISLYPTVNDAAAPSWGITILVVAINLLFGAALRNVKFPVPRYNKSTGWSCGEGYYLFRLFPKIAAVCIAWLLCYILTITDVFSDDPAARTYGARTDIKMASLENSKWFFFPLPGQWGAPMVDAGLVASMIVASLMLMIESVGDYYILARACEKPTPPRHALNRGLAMEGFINVLCGALNMGHGTASYSEPLQFVKVTGLASRMVWQILGCAMIFVAVVGKFAGALAMIPTPILGGINLTGIGLMIMAGLSNLQFVNLNSSRNLLILAVSLMTGICLPFWLQDNPGIINTGEELADEILTSLLSSAMFIGAVLGFTLDNLIPGTRLERGIYAYLSHLGAKGETKHTDESALSVYDLPLISRDRCGHVTCCTYIPFLPTHVVRPCCTCGKSMSDDVDLGETVDVSETCQSVSYMYPGFSHELETKF